jgi:pimeloyl-ACP methyl ester carboxylesterase
MATGYRNVDHNGDITMSSTNGDTAATVAAGRSVRVNGLSLYYEEHGAGDPLIVLHGGIGGPEMFGPNLPLLAAARRVIAVHLQGHGRTADIDRPLRYELMADDIAALLAHLEILSADLLGYSLGAGVALHTAMRHPEMVRKLVAISRPCKRDGWYSEVRASFDQMGPETGRFMSQSPLSQLYPTVDWPTLFAKIGDLERQEYDWSAQVAQLRMPVLLMFADADAVRLSHILEFYELLGGGQRDGRLDGSGRSVNRLAILPGCTHYDILATSAVAQAALPFLEASIRSS